ncbi:MAG: tetratricopeptide repeat protein [Moorea sp. SIO4E2]|nr:tetratricopeptide repeat protein [Moorena sp. SIO4E2]
MNQNLSVKGAAILATVVGVMGMGVAFPRSSWGQSIIAQQPSSPGSERAEELSLTEASQLNQQAIKLYQQGKYSEAIPLAERALEIRQEVLGEEHLDVATSLNNLALLYKSQGRYAEAEPLYQQALALRKKLLGEDHPHVATSLNNLALLYKSQGRYVDILTVLEER